ncbi:hypothetical protein [Macromonas bipunctata]|uniref:RCC1 domain-containing protein n=1 Tax=Macromonas bipunctata TaxID=183670 RepID=UPI0014761673
MASIIAGEYHTCAITTAGGVKCWGWNKYGQLGDGSTTDSSVPVAVADLTSGVASISTGEYHTCALTMAGGVKCWGANWDGQLGNPSYADSSVPVAVADLTSGVASISGGSKHTCALTKAGGVKCWGRNTHGQLGDGSTTDSSVPVAVVGLTSGLASVSTGEYHTCAITTAGGVKCWGWNEDGQLGDGSTTDSSVPVAVADLTSGVASISGGYHHTCVVTTAGGAKCWGANWSGQLGNPSYVNSSVPMEVINPYVVNP